MLLKINYSRYKSDKLNSYNFTLLMNIILKTTLFICFCFCFENCGKPTIMMLSPQNAKLAAQWITNQGKRFDNYTLLQYWNVEKNSPIMRNAHGRKIELTAKEGIAIESFDFCNYGTTKQYDFLGKHGRCFLYDQAIAAIAVLMYEEDVRQAYSILSMATSFQNKDGSFGFSWDTYGCKNEPATFYDFEYIRTGANAWLGYAMAYYQKITGDDAFLTPAMKLAGWMIGRINPTYKLIEGGFGEYEGLNFKREEKTWMSAEHNIDAWFFFSEMAKIKENEDYRIIKENIRTSLLKYMWNDKQGRFNQGLTQSGESDDEKALDVNSWGAMFLIACGENSKAERALKYVERKFSGHVEYNDTKIFGYKPYMGFSSYYGINWSRRNFVWSEGSLGVAMAYLKLNNKKKAQQIINEMSQLQTFDNRGNYGGLFYSVYNKNEITDFARAPSVGGTAWFLMVWSALNNQETLNSFWE